MCLLGLDSSRPDACASQTTAYNGRVPIERRVRRLQRPEATQIAWNLLPVKCDNERWPINQARTGAGPNSQSGIVQKPKSTRLAGLFRPPCAAVLPENLGSCACLAAADRCMTVTFTAAASGRGGFSQRQQPAAPVQR